MEALEIVLYVVLAIDFLLALGSFYFARKLLGWAYQAWKRGRPDPIYFNFGMAVLFMGLWLFFLVLLYSPLFGSHLVASFNFTGSLGMWILHFFYLFTIYYPTPLMDAPSIKIRKFVSYAVVILLTIASQLPGLFAYSVTRDFPLLYNRYNPVGLSIFVFYVVIISVLSIWGLVAKQGSLAGLMRANSGRVMLGTSVAVIFNALLGLVGYFFYEFNTTIFGSLFTFFVLAYIFSILRPGRVVRG